MGRRVTSSTIKRALVFFVSFVWWMNAAAVCGVGQIRFQSPLERTTSLYGATARALAEKPYRKAFVESGQRFLFQIPNLASSNLRVGVARGAFSVQLSSVILSSPVGGEYCVTLSPVLSYQALTLGGSLQYDVLDLGSLGASLLTVGVQGLAGVTGTVQIGFAIDGVRVDGTDYPGANIATYFIRRGRVNAVASCQLSRRGRVDVSMASWARLGALTVSAGYEGSTAVLRGALAVRVRPLVISAGGAAHPTLGITKSIFVRWGR